MARQSHKPTRVPLENAGKDDHFKIESSEQLSYVQGEYRGGVICCNDTAPNMRTLSGKWSLICRRPISEICPGEG